MMVLYYWIEKEMSKAFLITETTVNGKITWFIREGTYYGN